MGTGYEYSCPKCCKEHILYLGSGFGYPAAAEEIISQIQSGEYGQEIRRAYLDTSDPLVDCEYTLFYCPDCCRYESRPALIIYRSCPEDRTAGNPHRSQSEKQNWILRSEAEKRGLEQVFAFRHSCSKCHQPMLPVLEEDLLEGKQKLICQNCGKPISPDTVFCMMWD